MLCPRWTDEIDRIKLKEWMTVFPRCNKSNFNAKYRAFSTVYSISRVMTKHIRAQKMYAG